MSQIILPTFAFALSLVVIVSGCSAKAQRELTQAQANPDQAKTVTRTKTPQGNEALTRPLLVLVEDEHWVGEDTTFALYDDGRVIYAPRQNRAPNAVQLNRFPTLVCGGYVSVKLSAGELRRLWDNLRPDPKFFDLKTSYQLSDYSDQPVATVYAWRDGKRKRCCVYGDLRKDQEVRKKAPKEFLTLFDKIADYRQADAKPWMPEKFDVLLSSHDGWDIFDKEGQDWWRKEWPALKTEETKDKVHHYTIGLPSKEFEEFRRRWEKHGPIVKIGGKHFQVTYRFPLPQEQSWNYDVLADEP